ncbi:MAG: cupin domain-containing protein [Alphaproteobacteria bacterium]|jgi:quercetin dioxygenase-like cupin family protein|nr:cupin domain-containing protein [Alphaproteobacteria bacterium]
MNEADARPYTVEDRTIVAETDSLTVKVFTLAEGQEIPWHYHSEITDTFFCLEGGLQVETREPAARHLLELGESCAVTPKVAHRVSGRDGKRCRFLIVQGVGNYDYRPVGG